MDGIDDNELFQDSDINAIEVTATGGSGERASRPINQDFVASTSSSSKSKSSKPSSSISSRSNISKQVGDLITVMKDRPQNNNNDMMAQMVQMMQTMQSIMQQNQQLVLQMMQVNGKAATSQSSVDMTTPDTSNNLSEK